MLFTFEILHNWYDKFNEDYEPIYIRAQQSAIAWKSKIGNSDLSTNFKTDHNHKIYKGDIAIREDGKIYILDWNVGLNPNNQATQSTEMNEILTFTREFPDIVDDETGMVIEPGGTRIAIDSTPVIYSEYEGRPDYSAASGLPGMHYDHLITVTMQWNTVTKDVRLNDQFVIGPFTYRVINLDYAEVSIDHEYGLIKLNAKRVAGGLDYDA